MHAKRENKAHSLISGSWLRRHAVTILPESSFLVRSLSTLLLREDIEGCVLEAKLLQRLASLWKFKRVISLGESSGPAHMQFTH